MGSAVDRDATRRAYDEVAEDYAVLVPDLGVESRLDRAVIADFAARCAETGQRRVLDAGCGTGRVTAHLAALGLDVTGTDLSPGMVEVARRAHPHLSFRVQAMEEIEDGDASVDGVLAWYSLIHTAPEELPAVLGNLSRILRPGGWFLTGFHAGSGDRVDRSTAYGHAVDMTGYLHSPDHLTAVLERSGLHVAAQLRRAPERDERTPQAVLLARRVPGAGAG